MELHEYIEHFSAQEKENRLLRRERAILIDLEKTRTAIVAGMLSGAVYGGLVQDIARLNDALVALHQEARGGLVLPDGVPCRCVLCAPREE